MARWKLIISAMVVLGLLSCGDTPPQPRYPNEGPVADLTLPEYGTVFEDVLLDASGSYDPDGNIAEYQFKLGDSDETIIVGNANYTYAYSEPGVYSIVLTVIDDRGGSDTTTETLTVY